MCKRYRLYLIGHTLKVVFTTAQCPGPPHRYRAFKRGKAHERADRIRALAAQRHLLISVLARKRLHLAPPVAAAPTIRRRGARLRRRRCHRRQAGHRRRPGATTGQARGGGPHLYDQVLAESLNRSVVLSRVRGKTTCLLPSRFRCISTVANSPH